MKISLLENPQAKSAVLGWGRGMGHTGHDALVSAVIFQAQKTNATPFFVVSRSFGKDDPIPPEMKLAMYRKKFPKYAKMFSLPAPEKSTINEVLASIAAQGFANVTLVVGEDQKNAFGFLTRPDKSGTEPYKQYGLSSLNVMSRQDTKAPSSDPTSAEYHEGPRATPMREVLLDPTKSEEEQFAVWRQSMSSSLSDQEVLDMMNTAKENLVQFHTKKPRVKKASELKEFITRIKPMLKEANSQQKAKLLGLIKEARKQLAEYTVRNTKKFIQRAHDTEQGQKYGSLPYSSHPKAVANIGKKFFGTKFGPDAVKVALLHDVLEDTPYTPEQLAKKGFSKEIIQAVQLLTKNKNLSYADNIKNIINSGNKLAMMVKYSDNYMNFTGDKSHWDSDRAAQSQQKYLASLNTLGDVLGITKHIGDTNITENADYLPEK